jgi:hypothetical protein
MADALLSSSIASLKTKILSQITSATIIEVSHLARSAKQIGLGDDTDIETAFNSRVNQLYSTATPADIKILAGAIKQLKNDPTVSSLITNSDDITEGSVNTFHTTARVNTQLGAFSTNIVPDGNVTRNVGSAGNKLNTVFASTVTGLTTPVNNDDATSKTYVDTAIASGVNLAAVGEHIIPDANETYDLGSSTNKFRDLYLSGNSITLGTVELSDNGGSLEITPTGGGSAEPFATETYVTTQVNNLVDSAPGALDTLNELAAALGDDAAFSTTVTNSLATKLEASDLNGYATEVYVGNQIAAAGSYSDASVDAHLNKSSATTGQTLIWNGTDYSWGTPASTVDISGKQDKVYANFDYSWMNNTTNTDTAYYSSQEFNTQTSYNSTYGGIVPSQWNSVEISPDGTKIWTCHDRENLGGGNWLEVAVHQWTLTTPYDTSTMSNHQRQTFSAPAGGASPRGDYRRSIRWQPDGMKFYLVDWYFGIFYSYEVSTAFDVTTKGTQAFTNPSSALRIAAFDYNADGTKMFAVQEGDVNDYRQILEYNLSTPYDITTATDAANASWNYKTTFSSLDWYAVKDMRIINSGKTVIFANYGTVNGSHLIKLTLTTPYDFSTMSSATANTIYTSTMTGPSLADNQITKGLAVSSDGTSLYALGQYQEISADPMFVTRWKTGTTLLEHIATKGTSNFDGAYSSLTGAPTVPTNNNQLTNGAGYITSVPAQSFASLTSKPTTIAGYGITDATVINQTANVLSGASPQIDLTDNYFKIDLSSDTTFSTTGSPTNGEWYEGKIEVKGNASQLTHNLVTNPSNQISNWRTTASTPTISGFYSQGYSIYGFFAVSPNGQYAINGSYVGTGDYRFQIIEFSTPGDITSGSLVHQSGNVHGTISWQRSNVYFATNTKFVTSSGHVITVPSGSITTSNPYGSLPVVDDAGQGNWSSDGTKYIGVKEAQNQDPIFKLYTASTPFYANTLTLTQSYTFNKWSIGGDHSLKIDHGNNVHISDDGLNLYTAGFYQLNNWSNQMMMHFTLSTAFDLTTMTHTGNNLTGSYATFGHGRFIEGGAQYWAPKSNGVYGFQNLNTPAVLSTTTWPGTWGWEGGVSHSAPPNNETDIINFVSTDGGSTFNAWVEKDSDKSAGFDGQYSSLTGAPSLATVATSGSYNDLTNQPTIPSLTGYATETYVNTATANLVDSAPATLDTLNELAAALGDDANFSTTITNQIAAKANAYSIATVTAAGGNFYIDGVQQVTLSFEPGRTYRFDQADSSNSSHPLRFSTTSDGTHGSGSEYTTGVTTNGTAGSAGAYVQIAITHATPTLNYYCVNHSGMGAGSVVGNFSGAYSDLTGAPSIPSAYTDSAVDTHLNQSSATTGQLLSWNGSDYTWTTAASGVTSGSTAPSSPSAGDLWFDTDDLIMYVYYNDGSSNQWVEANSAQVGGSSVTNSDTAPSGAAAGDLWFKSDTADLFLYYTDADSSQWVQVGGAGQSTSGSGIQSSIATGNTSIATTDTGSDGTILFTTEGTARWEITNSGNILPKTNAAFDIGSAEKKVRDLYLDDSTIHLGDTPLSASNIDRSMEVYTDVAAPSSDTDIGTKGDVRIVGNHMYVCINTNTWVRTQIETSW